MRTIKHGADDHGRLHRLLSLDDAAFYLGLSYWTLRGLLHGRQIPHVRAGRRVLVDRCDLDRWIEANKTREEPL